MWLVSFSFNYFNVSIHPFPQIFTLHCISLSKINYNKCIHTLKEQAACHQKSDMQLSQKSEK